MFIREKASRHRLRNSKNITGDFDVSDPQYKVVLGEESYYLWINATYGSIMYENDSNTLYTLSKSSAKKIYDLLEK
jgi:hypothetical protein